MNIDDILKNKWAQSKQLHVDEYRYSYFNKYYSDMTKQAIKEIVETTVKMCAENAKTELTSTSIRVNKDSILNTINQITF